MRTRTDIITDGAVRRFDNAVYLCIDLRVAQIELGIPQSLPGFPNPSYRLKTGQFARVEANIGAKLPRVLVPQQSVVQTLDVSSVWVIRPDSTAEYRKVTPGETFGGMWAIESGLEPGETVAVTGLQKLRQGMRVVPVKK